jgi:hypothetical protein
MKTKYLALALTVVSLNTFAAKELFFKNDAGGDLVLTIKKCVNEQVAIEHPFYAYATEKDGTVHRGCWVIPSIADAPKDPNIKIIPVVNMYWETGERITYPSTLFNEREEAIEPTL